MQSNASPQLSPINFGCVFLGVLGHSANKALARVFNRDSWLRSLQNMLHNCGGPVFLISVAHSPIYSPSSLTFMNSGTVGPNVAGAVKCGFIYSFYI